MAGRTPAASPDHYQGQLITEAARFYSQLTKWNDRFDDTEPFRIEHLVYRPVPFAAEITHYACRFVLDITDTMEQKIAAISCYQSQFGGERIERLKHYVRSAAGMEGASAGFEYGETYALPRPAGGVGYGCPVGRLESAAAVRGPIHITAADQRCRGHVVESGPEWTTMPATRRAGAIRYGRTRT